MSHGIASFSRTKSSLRRGLASASERAKGAAILLMATVTGLLCGAVFAVLFGVYTFLKGVYVFMMNTFLIAFLLSSVVYIVFEPVVNVSVYVGEKVFWMVVAKVLDQLGLLDPILGVWGSVSPF